MKHLQILITLTIIAIASTCAFAATCSEKPKISLLVESLCPDSRNAVIKSFGPALAKGLLSMVDVKIIIYGKEQETYNFQTKKWEYTCQNGPSECYGNAFYNSLLKIMGGFSSEYLDAVVCIYQNVDTKNRDFDSGIKACTAGREKAFLNAYHMAMSFNYIQWQPLIQAASLQTPKYISNVPWINLNGEHANEADENAIVKDAFKWACEQADPLCKVEGCQVYENPKGNITFSKL